MSPTRNGKKVRINATVLPESWEIFQLEANDRTGGNISALLDGIAYQIKKERDRQEKKPKSGKK